MNMMNMLSDVMGKVDNKSDHINKFNKEMKL